MPELIRLDNPFRKYQRQIIKVNPGETIEQILERELKDNNRFECELITFINNNEITESERPKRILNEGEFLFVVPKVAGDDVGKTILNVITMVAFVYTGGALATAWGLGTMATIGLKVGFMVGGAMLVGALTPSPKMPSSGFLDDEQSQSFGWNPMTIQRQGISIPRAYGLNKMFANVISAYTEKETDTYEEDDIDEIFYQLHKKLPFARFRPPEERADLDPQKITLYSLFNIGVGPIREPVISDSLKLNDQKITNLVSVYYESRRGNIRQQQISYFDSTILEVVVNRLVVNGTPINYTTQNGNYNDLEIEISFPQGLFDGTGANLANNTVNVSVEIKKTTDTTWTFLANNVALTDDVGSKVIYTYSTVGVFTVDYGENYDIRVTKETAERNSLRYGDDLYLDKVREIIDQQFIYPRRALVGIKALATNQLSGSIRFSCLSRGLYVRQYSNSLGGAIGYSNNPADVIADILTQPVYTGEHSPWLDMTLFLNFNGADEAVTTLDESERGHAVSFTATAQLDTAQKKFGTASLLVDGNSDEVHIANDDYSFDICENTVEDWTIDCFVKHADHVGIEGYICQRVDGDNSWQLYHEHGVGLKFMVSTTAGGAIITLSGGEIADTNWHHVALCKVGNEYGLYLDGTQTAYVSDDSTATFDASLYIGALKDGNFHDGHIDHVRIFKQNFFSAAPNVGETDTITEPVAEYTDPGNSYAVSRYDGYNPSKLLTADFEELADWCDEAEINPVNFGIKSISQAANAVIETTNNNNLKIGETILFRGVSICGMVELVDGTTATILKVTNETTFTIDLDTSAYAAYTGAEPLLLVHFDGVGGSTTFTDEVGTHTITTVGGVEVSGTKKFGSGSGYFPGTDDALSIPDHADFDVFGSNLDNWTIDFWVRHHSLAGTQIYICQSEDGDNYWAVYRDVDGLLSVILVTGGVIKILSGGGAIDTLWTWYHIALCKVANEYGLYVDGVQVAYIQDDDTDTFAGKLYIGSFYSVAGGYSNELYAHKDELCLVDNNRFNAAPVVGLTDTIVVPTAPLVVGIGTVEKYQPRFAFNGIFDAETNMWEAALSVCELCRCVPFWDGDIIRLAIDKAGSSVYAFTMGNILKNTFKQKFIPTAERAGEIEVHYRDAAKDYVRMPFTLVNDDIGNTTSKTRLDLFGITDTDMANRLADFKLLQNLNLKKIVIIEAEIESIACTIGDIVDIQHDVTNWGQIGSGDEHYTGGGRVVAISTVHGWLGINSSHLDSVCGDESAALIEDALNGTDNWGHNINETHWFIIDMGASYTVKKIRGRSDNPLDPININIYVSENKASWGAAVASGITTIQDSTVWVEVDTTDKVGRYVKIEIADTEGAGAADNYLTWGYSITTPFTIFDIFVEKVNEVITIAGEIKFDDADYKGGSTTYKLLIKSSTDAVPESKTITGLRESSVVGGSYDIMVSGTFTVEPKRDDIWAAGEEDLETNKYRILDIRRTEENRAEITAIEYNSDVYAND